MNKLQDKNQARRFLQTFERRELQIIAEVETAERIEAKIRRGYQV
jgi:pyruvate kinase